jgi:hypothetical protein
MATGGGTTGTGVTTGTGTMGTGGTSGTDDGQSGSRLKGKYVMGADGSKEYLRATAYTLTDPTQGVGPTPVHAVWYDSMLQDDCTFLDATDSMLHCLPGLPTVAGAFGFYVFYLDAQCTQPFVVQVHAGAGCLPYTVPKYVQTYGYTPNCSFFTQVATTHVLQVGSLIAQPVTAYAGMGPSNCSAINWNNLNPMACYSATEVPPSSFVQAATGQDM